MDGCFERKSMTNFPFSLFVSILEMFRNPASDTEPLLENAQPTIDVDASRPRIIFLDIKNDI